MESFTSHTTSSNFSNANTPFQTHLIFTQQALTLLWDLNAVKRDVLHMRESLRNVSALFTDAHVSDVVKVTAASRHDADAQENEENLSNLLDKGQNTVSLRCECEGEGE